jgi:hypothetical protein
MATVPSSRTGEVPVVSTAVYSPSRGCHVLPDGGEETASGLHVLMIAALYAIPLLAALHPITDPDIWWHMRVGQWVVEHQTVPLTDPFSQWGLDKPWVAYSWLFEVLVFQLHTHFGLAGLVAYRVAGALAVTAALHGLIRRHEARFLVATGLTAVAAVAVAPVFSERPWLFTVLFTTFTLQVILEFRAGRPTRLAWLLPLVYLFWANLHIQFVYGLFLLGLACAAPLVDQFLARRDFAITGPAFSRSLLLLTTLCVLATLVNPYHVRLYGVVLEYARQPGPFRVVNELRALEFREISDWVMLAVAGAAVFALGRRQHLSSFDVLLLIATALFAFRARRDLWFLVLGSVAVLSNTNPQAASFAPRVGLRPLSFVLILLLLGGVGASAVWQRNLSGTHLQQEVAETYPTEAAAWVTEHGYPGPLYNDFNWGGYLIWSLPDLPVALDGRTNLHGDERILRFGNTWAAGRGWRDDPDLSAAGVVIAEAQSPLGCVLVLDNRFTLVHEDAVARVFVRAH